MKKEEKTPADFNLSAQICPGCGRYLTTEPTSPWMVTLPKKHQRFSFINWDHKGEFYYIAKASHVPGLCKLFRRK